MNVFLRSGKRQTCRVGELIRLNIDDIDFSERECIVYGKGDKERKKNCMTFV